MDCELNEQQKSMMRSVSKNIIGKFDLNPIPIHTGLHGEIFHIINQADKQSLILKVIWKNNQALYKNEKKIHYSLKNRFIVQLENCFGDEINYYLVMEYCKNGNLRSALQHKLSIDLVKDYGLQIAKGLHYLHKNRIIHHDLKPENILIGSNNQLKICDFGLAVQYEEGKSAKGCQGTLAYAPPEAIELHNESYDVWSFGCLLYQMATGRTPFSFNSWKELTSTIKEQYLSKFHYDSSLPETLVHLLKRIFVYDKRQRITIDQVIKHSFFTGDPLENPQKQQEGMLLKKRSTKGMTKSVELRQSKESSKESSRQSKYSKDNKQNIDSCNRMAIKKVNAPNYKDILQKKFKKQEIGSESPHQRSKQKQSSSRTAGQQKRYKQTCKVITQTRIDLLSNIAPLASSRNYPSPLKTLNMRIAPIKIKNTEIRIDKNGITRQISIKDHPTQLINISCDGQIIKMKKGRTQKIFTLDSLPAKFYNQYEQCKRILKEAQSEQARLTYTDKNFLGEKALKIEIMYDKKIKVSLEGQFQAKQMLAEQLLANVKDIKEDYHKQIRNVFLRLIEMNKST